MKKKIIIGIIITSILLVLFIPIPHSPLRDGGTREYVALTYKIVDWHRITGNGIFEKVSFYGPSDINTPIDELWMRESENTDIKNQVNSDLWLDKETSEKCENNLFGDIVITEINEDCFFARRLTEKSKINHSATAPV